jgi:hypothetical protein
VTTVTTICAGCGRNPVEDARLCSACTWVSDWTEPDQPCLERDLGDVRALSEGLVDLFTRQTRRGLGGGSRSAETALPFDARAIGAAFTLRTELTTWVRELDMGDAPSEQHGLADRCPYPRQVSGNARQLAAWLLARLERLRHHAAAEEALYGIWRACKSAQRALDGPPERWFAGPCEECGHDLYATPGRETVQCLHCDPPLVYDVADRRRWLLEAAQEYLGTATEVSRAITALGDEPVTHKRILNWRDSGMLMVRGHTQDADKHSLYRLGDVQDLVIKAAQRQAERAEKRARKVAV